MGLWVDYTNLIFNPLGDTDQRPQFILAGLKGRVARLLLRCVPWVVCGEIVFVARVIR